VRVVQTRVVWHSREDWGDEGGGAGAGGVVGGTGTRKRFGRICLSQTGHHDVSKSMVGDIIKVIRKEREMRVIREREPRE
jgi:hypothetical protein